MKKRKKYLGEFSLRNYCLLLFLFLTCIKSYSSGQTFLNSSVFIEQVGQSQSAQVEQSGTSGNEVFLYQNGEDNRMVIEQKEAMISGLPDEGLPSFIMAEQNGSGNSTTIMQYGGNNEYRVLIAGYDNELSALQYGSGNKIYQEISGVKNNWSIRQLGNDNLLIHVSDRFNSLEGKIIQKGDGIKTIVKD